MSCVCSSLHWTTRIWRSNFNRLWTEVHEILGHYIGDSLKFPTPYSDCLHRKWFILKTFDFEAAVKLRSHRTTSKIGCFRATDFYDARIPEIVDMHFQIGLLNERINEWVSEWVIDWLTKWMNEWINEWMNQSINQSINESISQWINQ